MSESLNGESEARVRGIDGVDIGHVEDQNRGLRSAGLIAGVAPTMPVKLQTSQPFCAVDSLVRSTSDSQD